MDVQEKISVTYLTTDSVSMLKQQYVDIDGELTQIDEDWRRSYTNSPLGREDLQAEISEPYLSSVLAIWGDAPTVEDLDLTDVEGGLG